MKKDNYSVTFLVRAVCDVEVKASTPEEAQEAARKLINKKGLFAEKISYVDGSHDPIGVTNLSKWEQTRI